MALPEAATHPEAVAPEARAEGQARNAWEQLMFDVLEADREVLKQEATDATRTRIKIIQNVWDIFDVPLLLNRWDTNLRGRDADNLRKRTGRIIANSVALVGLTAVDLLDSGVEALHTLGVPGYVASSMWEYMVGSAVEQGTNKVGAFLTKKPDFEYASRLSKKMGQLFNLVPGVRQLIDSGNIEAAWRITYNLPVLGVPFELAYRAGNQLVTRLEQSPQGKWFDGLLLAVGAGLAKGFQAQQAAKRTAGARP